MRRALLAAGLVLAAPAPGAAQQLDLLIRGGSVYDGTGAAPRRADVGIRGDRIVLVGDGRAAGAARVIDAAGLVVAPGFIDPHTHTGEDLDRPATAAVPFLLHQGVTTVVVGNDGGGPVDVAGTLARWERQGIGVNALLLAGFGTIRREVLGMADRAPGPAELERMQDLARRAMAGGAFGLSTGLYYAPQSFATTDEVVAVAAAAAGAGAYYYDSHIRDESSYSVGLLAAVREALEIGRRAGLPVHLAHVKALGVDVWGRSDSVIAIVREARAAGQRVTADQYPYTASGTGLSASLLPRWAEAGGWDAMLRRLDDPALRERLRAEVADNMRRRGGASSFLITSGRWTGRRLDAIAGELGTDPVSAAFALLREGPASVASFNMDEADLERLMRAEFVVTGSDGSAGHPRKYGAFPRKLRRYSLDRGVLPFARAIESSTSQTAAIVGLADRGTLREGFVADVIVFDSATVVDRATYEAPREPAGGMRYVVVNGRLALDGGAPVPGLLAGRALRRPEAGR
jgi:N-acyl-D-amino-acid deacylase